jgi:hypothetical protein
MANGLAKSDAGNRLLGSARRSFSLPEVSEISILFQLLRLPLPAGLRLETDVKIDKKKLNFIFRQGKKILD